MNTEVVYLRERLSKKQLIITLLLFTCSILVLVCLSLVFKIHDMKYDYDHMSSSYTYLQNDKDFAIKESSRKDNTIENLKSVIKQQDTQLSHISEINKAYVDELNFLYGRKELFDKYEYAVINEVGDRTCLTYEQIKLGQDLMLENGYDPNLLLGTIMVESGGDPSRVNEESGATGLGQFLDESAEFVWCDLMGNDYYDPEIRKDAESNIKMMACYYDYLYKQEYGDTFNVIKRYSGNVTDWGTSQYIQRINNFTSKVGVLIS